MGTGTEVSGLRGERNTSVVTEEYVPKVIIEAKWGINEEELGRVDRIIE